MIHRIFNALLGLLLLTNLFIQPLRAENPVPELSVFYTNDINGYLEPCG